LVRPNVPKRALQGADLLTAGPLQGAGTLNKERSFDELSASRRFAALPLWFDSHPEFAGIVAEAHRAER
jgi:hypothetical protein